MSKKSIITVSIITAFCFAFVLALYAISEKPFKYRHNFQRTFAAQQPLIENVLLLKNGLYYVAGFTDHEIYFGNRADTLEVLITDKTLKNSRTVHINLEQFKISKPIDTTQQVNLDLPIHHQLQNLKLVGSHLEIDSPYFYIKSGSTPIILRGTTNTWQAGHYLDSIPYFTSASKLNENISALLTIGTTGGSDSVRNLICKVSKLGVVAVKPHIFEGQEDNFFSTMGSLRYSKTLNNLVYIYSYRNQYLLIDTLLNVIGKGNTIDPVAIADINPIKLDEWASTLASPGSVVNSEAQVYKNLLFIKSNLKASNESILSFDNASVIDVYDIEKKKYVFSFHIPDYESIKMTTFKVSDQHVIALHEQYAVSYFLEQITN